MQKRSCNTFDIEWSTPTAINNVYFIAARSIDDVYNFVEIAEIWGSGTSLEKKYYQSKDKLEVAGEHQIYCRLKQTNLDET